VSRKRISWLGATLLSLYHLHITEAPSNLGFYHWRTDVARLIATHWSDIFGPAVKKKKTWQGSVSGSLSGNASTLFESGLCTTGEQGWWRLRSLDLPALQLSRLAPKVVARQAKPMEGVQEVLSRRGDRGSCSSLALAIARKEAWNGLVAIPMSSKKEKVKKKRGEKRRLMEDGRRENLKVENEEECFEEEVGERLKNCEDYEEETFYGCNSDGQYYENSSESSSSLLKVSRVNNLLEPGPSRSPSTSSSSTISCPSVETATSTAPSPPPESPCPPSPPVSCLFDDDTASIEEMEEAAIDEAVVSSFEEEERGNILGEVIDSATDETPEQCQNINTENTAEAKEMPINISSPSANITFDLTSFASIPRDNERDLSDEELSPHLPDDEEMSPHLPEVKLTMCKNSAVGDEVQTVNRLQEPDSSCNSQTEDENENEAQVLDRFQHQGSSVPLCQSLVVEASVITDWSVSPFTGARLSPYVRRDTETEPSGLAVLRRFDSFATRLHPIDFCYLQPQLVPAVNCLAEKLFWPGIDLAEGLLFPDFSCVALYKRLCVGFGLVVPDCRWSESYLSHLAVHPAWRGSGLATFMLYHLIQTNLGKDLTLHVSASNPALLLYQKFGFKVEEFVSNFYTRYLPPDSQQSPHALFLRLAR